MTDELGGTVLPGDVVVLRSGGPAMTVDELRDTDYALCWWFVGMEKHREAFERRALIVLYRPNIVRNPR